MAFGRCSRGHNRFIRWVEPVFVQITYNGKVLVERMKVFPNGSQRVHATVLAEKKAGSFFCAHCHVDTLTIAFLLHPASK